MASLQRLGGLLIFTVCSSFITVALSILNFDELHNSKYGIEITSVPVLLREDSDISNSMLISSKHGQQYQCSLPLLKTEDTVKDTRTDFTTAEITDLLKSMQGRCLYHNKGWWTYEFCYGKSVSQYHEEANIVVGDKISLGIYSSQTDWSKEKIELPYSKNSSKRFHSQFFVNGTKCDLNGELRSTEVKFKCEPGGRDHITLVDEPSSCTYVMVVHTNKLCNHPLFKPPADHKPLPITCSPALPQERYQMYLDTVEREKKAKAKALADKIRKLQELDEDGDFIDDLTEGSRKRKPRKSELWPWNSPGVEDDDELWINGNIGKNSIGVSRLDIIKGRKMKNDKDQVEEEKTYTFMSRGMNKDRKSVVRPEAVEGDEKNLQQQNSKIKKEEQEMDKDTATEAISKDTKEKKKTEDGEKAKLTEDDKEEKKTEDSEKAKLTEDDKEEKKTEDGEKAKMTEDDKEEKKTEDGEKAKLTEDDKEEKKTEDGEKAKMTEDDKDEKKTEDSEKAKMTEDDKEEKKTEDGEKAKLTEDDKEDKKTEDGEKAKLTEDDKEEKKTEDGEKAKLTEDDKEEKKTEDGEKAKLTEDDKEEKISDVMEGENKDIHQVFTPTSSSKIVGKVTEEEESKTTIDEEDKLDEEELNKQQERKKGLEEEWKEALTKARNRFQSVVRKQLKGMGIDPDELEERVKFMKGFNKPMKTTVDKDKSGKQKKDLEEPEKKMTLDPTIDGLKAAVDKKLENLMQSVTQMEQQGKLEKNSKEKRVLMNIKKIMEGMDHQNVLLMKKEETLQHELEKHFEELRDRFNMELTMMKRLIDDIEQKRIDNAEGEDEDYLKNIVEKLKTSVQRFDASNKALSSDMEAVKELNKEVHSKIGDLVAGDEVNRKNKGPDFFRLAAKGNLLLRRLLQRSAQLDKDMRAMKEVSEDIKARKEEYFEEFSGDQSADYKRHAELDKEAELRLGSIVQRLKKMFKGLDEGGLETDGKTDMFGAEDPIDTTGIPPFGDDNIRVRVAKIKGDDGKTAWSEDEDEEKKEKSESEMGIEERLMRASKRMERLVKKQLKNAGISPGGKVRVKIITSRDALENLGGNKGMELLSDEETNQFRDMIMNLMGGSTEAGNERKRQAALENNYNLVWGENRMKNAPAEEEEEPEAELVFDDTDRF